MIAIKFFILTIILFLSVALANNLQEQTIQTTQNNNQGDTKYQCQKTRQMCAANDPKNVFLQCCEPYKCVAKQGQVFGICQVI
ncbi:transmembrane protein, putative (macronuclear) [Tetrahymena thermophila SB210]|uniref:Transmembrane protein, putative n=1 Tax=Tetrahymena thermophila (strain SB210) TaxID=312017 RepID=Q22LW0_TETTS|nr:transmembrane protein, putative [Tetrahymena thermophila SB210]EAR86646.2 transmembrane protein, putative [Tetrahymena thermophila SB210]|eukprot:XP_977260.2 transmembrane protein, putative [Tetrahymena thermophila SB210]